METVLYADVLFLIDFSMDFLAVYITGKLMHEKIGAMRTAISAVIGGAVSVLTVIFALPPTAEATVGILTPLVMGEVAYAFPGERTRTKAERYALIMAAGMLLGGAVTAVISLGGTVGAVGPAAHTKGIVPLMAGGVCAACLFSLIGRRKDKRSVYVKIVLDGRSAEVDLLADSGNLLRDPFTGVPVIIASLRAVSPLFTESERLSFERGEYEWGDRLIRRIRLIPSESVNGDGMLPAVKPDEVIVDGKRKRCVFAVSPKSGFGGYDGIIPKSLL